jgi:hypothetical protein
MPELSRFLPEDQDLLVGLFYRVGLWMSHIDDTDEDETSETAEHEQLLRVLAKISKTESAAVLIREMADEAVRQKQSWARWERRSDSLLEDVGRGLKLLKGQGVEAEIVSFRKALMFIGTSVARAYREDQDMERTGQGGLSWLSEKASEMLTAVADREAYRDLSISPAEDTALSELLEALKQ